MKEIGTMPKVISETSQHNAIEMVKCIKTKYNELQQLTRDVEDLTGKCQDGISDIYYERFDKLISEFESAISHNKEIDVVELESTKASIDIYYRDYKERYWDSID